MSAQLPTTSTVSPASRWARLLQRPVPPKLAVLAILASLLIPLVIPLGRWLQTSWGWEHIEQATLAILKGENLAFLVTDKLTSQIVVEASDNSPLLGKREGVLIGTVTLYYGVDVQALDRACLQRSGQRMLVRLPEPRELDFSVDPTSFRFITKRSGWNVIVDYLWDRNLEAELRKDVHPHALAFFRDKHLIPTREKIVAQLNDLAAPFSKELGVQVEFQ